MPLVILPKSSDPDGTTKARTLLNAMIEDPLTVVALVGGEGLDSNAAVETAVARAAVKPAIRRVVWVTDKTVLDADERDNFFPDDTVLATVGLSDTVAERLSASKAKVRFFVERAFTSAEDQQP